MEAVVVGPGKAILFYGRHSLGEGLKVDKARDVHISPDWGRSLGRKDWPTSPPTL